MINVGWIFWDDNNTAYVVCETYPESISFWLIPDGTTQTSAASSSTVNITWRELATRLATKEWKVT